MDIVERIKVEKWTNRDGEDVTSYRVTLVNETGQREVPCYSPLGKDLKEDAPLPEGWEVKTSKAGKPYLAAPRQSSGGGGAGSGHSTAWRNTEAGAKYEQEKTDRRTAIMQAPRDLNGFIIWDEAERIFSFLRESVSTPGREQDVKAGGTVTAAVRPAPGVGANVDEGGDKSNKGASGEAPPRPPKRMANEPPAGWDS